LIWLALPALVQSRNLEAKMARSIAPVGW